MGMEFIATQTSTGSDFTEFTFADAVDFADYSEMYCSFQLGTGSNRDINARLGDTAAGAVLTTPTYDLIKSDNTAGTFSSVATTGMTLWVVGEDRVDSVYGLSGYVRVFLVRNSSNETFLASQGYQQGKDSFFITSGYNTTVDAADLKYFRLYVGADDLESGSNVTCYKLKRS